MKADKSNLYGYNKEMLLRLKLKNGSTIMNSILSLLETRKNTPLIPRLLAKVVWRTGQRTLEISPAQISNPILSPSPRGLRGGLKFKSYVL